MATISVTIPDDQLQRVRNALCDYNGYKPKLEDGSDNPVSRAEFAKLVVARLIKDVVRAHEQAVARAAAAAASEPDVT